MKDRYFIEYGSSDILKEKDIRKLSLDFETNDILNNKDEYLNEELSLISQLDIIKNSVYGDIDSVINNLKSWGIDICEIKSTNREIDEHIENIKGSDNLDYIQKQLDMIYKLREIDIKEGSVNYERLDSFKKEMEIED